MTSAQETTLRLIFPQWQGGNNPPYYLGSHLLAWLSPKADGPVEEVSVPEPDGAPLLLENGVIARQALLDQALRARTIIEKHQPARIVVLGGDCLVDLSPFAYLNERYDGDLAVLWVDAHPDVMTPSEFQHAHAMVLGNLLGEGDADFAGLVRKPLDPANVMYAGLGQTLPMESDFIARLGLATAGPDQLVVSSDPVLDWFRSTGARHLAIHLDLDVLDPKDFRSLLFAQPNVGSDAFEGVAQGKMSMKQVSRLLGDISGVADVVGLGIAEHLPWDAAALKTFIAGLPLIGQPSSSG